MLLILLSTLIIIVVKENKYLIFINALIAIHGNYFTNYL